MARGLSLKSLSDLRRFVGKVLNELYRDEMPEGRARALFHGASVLKDVIRDGDLEQRISQLEKTMKENGNEKKF
ncbi:hypothetical protein [Desulfobacter sp.]|uniref:hypothetical protein n=1 Tax=Desulfobacter sp. TaxID=2294 RepID=UPI003D1063C1